MHWKTYRVERCKILLEINKVKFDCHKNTNVTHKGMQKRFVRKKPYQKIMQEESKESRNNNKKNITWHG